MVSRGFVYGRRSLRGERTLFRYTNYEDEALCEVVYLKEAQANFVRPQVSPLSVVRGLIERGHRLCQRLGQLARVYVSPVNFDRLAYT